MGPINLFVFLISAISFVSSNQIICYYGTWATYRPGNGRFDTAHIDPHLCTHLIYSFAGINDHGTIISLDPWLDLPDNGGRNNFGQFNALKQRNPGLKTLLAVGGYNEGSAKYSIMAANPGFRQNFINSAIHLLITHGFDGLDVDWEYPNRRDTVHGHADINNFTTLLRELREAFNRHGLMLTAAVAAVRDMAITSYDVPAISRYLDIVNLMTYDLGGAWDPMTGHNAPLHRGENYGDNNLPQNFYTVQLALEYWIDAGCPRDKIALGVPFYARTFSLSYAGNNGVRAPANGAGMSGPYSNSAGFMGYNEACHKFRTEWWDMRYDHYARVPYGVQGHNWVTFDDADSIRLKINFAKSLGINKVMVWSIETDDFYGICGEGVFPLLHSIRRNL